MGLRGSWGGEGGGTQWGRGLGLGSEGGLGVGLGMSGVALWGQGVLRWERTGSTGLGGCGFHGVWGGSVLWGGSALGSFGFEEAQSWGVGGGGLWF